MIIEDKSKAGDIKRNRVKSYFISAAKDIIINDGISNVSVRKIADMSGYSYGSIYNYYKDLNELLFEVKNLMLLDLFDVMSIYLEDKKYDVADIKKINHKYVDYFIDNPNIYHFFYTYQLKETEPAVYEQMDMGTMYWTTYKGLVVDGVIKEEDVPIIAKTLVYTLQGLLAMYFSSNGLSKERLHLDLDEIIDYVLKG